MQHKKIKPLLKHSIAVRTLDNYHEFLCRRYKGTLHYKFDRSRLRFSGQRDKETPSRLFRVLQHLKLIKTIDLTLWRMSYNTPNESLITAIIKRTRRAETITIHRFNENDYSFENLSEKWPRYLLGVRKLIYEFKIGYSLMRDANRSGIPQKIRNSLRNLKSCPKITSIIVKAPHLAKAYSVSFYEFQRYPSKTKHLIIQSKLSTEELNSSPECLKDLESIQLSLDLKDARDSSINILTNLLDLDHLKEISLNFAGHLGPEIPRIFTKISQKGILKKLTLSFDYDTKDFHQILKAFKGSKLTQFSFKAQTTNSNQLSIIAKFLEEFGSLEDLELDISNHYHFREPENLKLLSQNISKLQALRSLRLSLRAFGNFYPKDFLPNFAGSLQNLFTKQIKLESFCIKSNQISAAEFLPSLIEIIKPASSFLHELEIDLGEYSPDKKSREKISIFMKGLQNVRVLKLVCFEISDKKLLGEIAQAVCSMKDLEVLALGKFCKGTVTKPILFEGLKNILKKRGLRTFEYQRDHQFADILKNKKKISLLNLKQIMKINPSLEYTPENNLIFEAEGLPKCW